MAALTTSLWFDGNAEAAVAFYASVFDDVVVTNTLRFTEAGPGPEGSVLLIAFTLRGQQFIAINGGPQFSFSGAISFVIDCADQAEVDRYWAALTVDGGTEHPCGWLTDKFGITWQVTPRRLTELLSAGDAEASTRMTRVMYTMSKLDIAALEAAYFGDT
jgi:predicted 3-demethylubiquinone-9 3-methyltransferase (glyoxalase superfamily)